MEYYICTRKVEKIEISEEDAKNVILEYADENDFDNEDIDWINNHSLEDNISENIYDEEFMEKLLKKCTKIDEEESSISLYLTKDDAIQEMEFGIH